MKKISTLFKICFALFILSMASCSSDDNSGPNEPINTAELKLFVIDTARVNSISATGTNEIILLNRSVNNSSYIGGFSVSPNGKKFAYADHQMSGTVPNLVFTDQLRVANSDGTGDASVYDLPNPGDYFDLIKIGSDGKIFFRIYKTNPVGYETHLMNLDGTGLENVNYSGDIMDVSDNREYYLRRTESGIQILDADLDNGLPGLYHSENIPNPDDMENGVFTNDGKNVVVAFRENNTFKARIINVAAKTSTTITLVDNIQSEYVSCFIQMASDGKRGVATINGENYPKSKSYIFDIKTGTVKAPFENNDENVYRVYAW